MEGVRIESSLIWVANGVALEEMCDIVIIISDKHEWL